MRQAKAKTRNSVKRKRVRSKSNKPGRRTKRKLRGGYDSSDFQELVDALEGAKEHNFKDLSPPESLSKEIQTFKDKIKIKQISLKEYSELLNEQSELIEKIKKIKREFDINSKKSREWPTNRKRGMPALIFRHQDQDLITIKALKALNKKRLAALTHNLVKIGQVKKKIKIK
mgnify:CR=1 FL=1|tara:strand:- start:46 stop:561 length:516 start_codon:yes stop_codon:yes gene_type:complete